MIECKQTKDQFNETIKSEENIARSVELIAAPFFWFFSGGFLALIIALTIELLK